MSSQDSAVAVHRRVDHLLSGSTGRYIPTDTEQWEPLASDRARAVHNRIARLLGDVRH